MPINNTAYNARNRRNMIADTITFRFTKEDILNLARSYTRTGNIGIRNRMEKLFRFMVQQMGTDCGLENYTLKDIADNASILQKDDCVIPTQMMAIDTIAAALKKECPKHPNPQTHIREIVEDLEKYYQIPADPGESVKVRILKRLVSKMPLGSDENGDKLIEYLEERMKADPDQTNYNEYRRLRAAAPAESSVTLERTTYFVGLEWKDFVLDESVRKDIRTAADLYDEMGELLSRYVDEDIFKEAAFPKRDPKKDQQCIDDGIAGMLQRAAMMDLSGEGSLLQYFTVEENEEYPFGLDWKGLTILYVKELFSDWMNSFRCMKYRKGSAETLQAWVGMELPVDKAALEASAEELKKLPVHDRSTEYRKGKEELDRNAYWYVTVYLLLDCMNTLKELPKDPKKNSGKYVQLLAKSIRCGEDTPVQELNTGFCQWGQFLCEQMLQMFERLIEEKNTAELSKRIDEAAGQEALAKKEKAAGKIIKDVMDAANEASPGGGQRTLADMIQWKIDRYTLYDSMGKMADSIQRIRGKNGKTSINCMKLLESDLTNSSKNRKLQQDLIRFTACFDLEDTDQKEYSDLTTKYAVNFEQSQWKLEFDLSKNGDEKLFRSVTSFLNKLQGDCFALESVREALAHPEEFKYTLELIRAMSVLDTKTFANLIRQKQSSLKNKPKETERLLSELNSGGQQDQYEDFCNMMALLQQLSQQKISEKIIYGNVTLNVGPYSWMGEPKKRYVGNAMKDLDKTPQFVKYARYLEEGRLMQKQGTRELMYLLGCAYDMKVYSHKDRSDTTGSYEKVLDLEKRLLEEYLGEVVNRMHLANITDSKVEKQNRLHGDGYDGSGFNFRNHVEAIAIFYLLQDLPIRTRWMEIEHLRKDINNNPDSGWKEESGNPQRDVDTLGIREAMEDRDASGSSSESADIANDYAIDWLRKTDYRTFETMLNEEYVMHGLTSAMQYNERPARLQEELLNAQQEMDASLKKHDMLLFRRNSGLMAILKRKYPEHTAWIDPANQMMSAVVGLVYQIQIEEGGEKNLTREKIVACYATKVLNEALITYRKDNKGNLNLFAALQNAVDPVLKECRVHPLDEKNLFDFLIVTSMSYDFMRGMIASMAL